MASITLNGVSKTYPGGVAAVTDFDLEIADREFVVLVGPSGCGKSTTLRMIAGLEDITSGEIRIGERVALGRAMVREPSAFLFDEPLSNIDAKLRASMRTEIRKLHERLGATFVFVTHDMEVAAKADVVYRISDGVILMSEGASAG
jgi:ABC-type sugar transport system ATPase subunit